MKSHPGPIPLDRLPVDSRDLAWMSDYRKDVPEAFGKIYGAYSGHVYGYLRKRLKNAGDIDELFQKVWMKFHDSRENWSPDYPLLQWIFVISRSVLIDFFRSEGIRTEPLVSAESEFGKDVFRKAVAPPSGEALEKEANEEMETIRTRLAHEGLTKEQVAVVQLRVFEEAEYDEIAKKIGKTSVSVRKIFSRAMEKLKSPKLRGIER